MKKSFLLIAALTVFLTGCATIPEPTAKTSNLLYGKVFCTYQNQTNNDFFPANDYDSKNISATIQNRKTKKVYTVNCNSNGELIRAGLPEGAYRLLSLKKNVTGANGYASEFGGVIRDGDARYHFYIKDNCVSNIGEIRFNIELINSTKYTWNLNWGVGYDNTRDNFRLNHPESAWNDEEWINLSDAYSSKN